MIGGYRVSHRNTTTYVCVRLLLFGEDKHPTPIIKVRVFLQTKKSDFSAGETGSAAARSFALVYSFSVVM